MVDVLLKDATKKYEPVGFPGCFNAFIFTCSKANYILYLKKSKLFNHVPLNFVQIRKIAAINIANRDV